MDSFSSGPSFKGWALLDICNGEGIYDRDVVLAKHA